MMLKLEECLRGIVFGAEEGSCPISGVSCDKRIPLRLNGRIYHKVVRPTLLCRAECQLIKNYQVQRAKVAEMRMFRWICDHSRLDKVKNGVIRDKVGVILIECKIRDVTIR